MNLGEIVRGNPIAALAWIEGLAIVAATLADVSLIGFDPQAAAINRQLYPITALVGVLCVGAIFSVPHAPNRRYAVIVAACATLLILGCLPPPGLLVYVLASIIAARLTFAFGFRGAAIAWVLACVVLSARVYSQIHSAATASNGPQGLIAYLLAVLPFAILLALIFAMISMMKMYAVNSADAAAAGERTRIALDLHDFLGHGLTTLRVQLQNAESYFSKDPGKAADYIRQAVDSSGELLADVRETVSLLHDGGEQASPSFAVLFDRLCADFSSAHDLIVEHTLESAIEPTGRIAVAIHRTIQEALTNISRHAAARHVWIVVRARGARIEARIEDDGCGFNSEAAPQGHGLISMRERIANVGGDFSIFARAQGGTVVQAVVPIEAAR